MEVTIEGDFKTKSLGPYRRKRDGVLVTAGEWPDGDVTWMIENIAVIATGSIVGTCSKKTFLKGHVPA